MLRLEGFVSRGVAPPERRAVAQGVRGALAALHAAADGQLGGGKLYSFTDGSIHLGIII